jgi:hypothetical protein
MNYIDLIAQTLKGKVIRTSNVQYPALNIKMRVERVAHYYRQGGEIRITGKALETTSLARSGEDVSRSLFASSQFEIINE